jgi:Fe-S-cluster containining protein
MARKHYPQEKNNEWFTILMDAYAISDEGTLKNLAEDSVLRGQKVACRKGCDNCCKRASAPINPLEFRGIFLYVNEIMDGNLKKKLTPRLISHKSSTECPFLMDAKCSIYAVRPVICRSYFVFNKVCGANEDVSATRRQDMFLNIKNNVPQSVLAKFYDYKEFGVLTETQKREAIAGGHMMKISTIMHMIDWADFAKKLK